MFIPPYTQYTQYAHTYSHTYTRKHKTHILTITLPYNHTHRFTHTYVHTHTHIHTFRLNYTEPHTHLSTQSCSFTLRHTHVYTAHTCIEKHGFKHRLNGTKTTHMHISTHTDIPKETQTYTHTHKTHVQTHRRTLIHGTKTHVQNHTQIHTHSGLSSIWVSPGNLPYLHPALPEPRSHCSQGTGRARKRPVSPSPTSQIYILGQDTGGQRLGGGGGVGAAPPQVSMSPPVTCILESTCHPHTLEEKGLDCGGVAGLP